MNILIVGGGSAGWMTAAYFESKKKYKVTLIESNNIPIIGVGESTVPGILDYMEDIGLSEEELFTDCNAIRKYSIQHNNWTKENKFWWHYFGFDESDEEEQRFWLKTNQKPNKKYRHAYHFDANLIGPLLKNKFKNINHIIDDIIDINIDENGISKLIGKKDNYIADLYIDCTGFRQTLRSKFTRNRKNHSDLHNNCAIACPGFFTETVKKNYYTETYAMDYGWRWRISLQNRSGNGYVFNKDLITIDQARDEFIKKTPNINPDKIFVVPFENSYETEPWIKNVIAVGLSSGFLEPLESTAIFLAHGPVKLIEKLLTDQKRQEKYNRIWRKVYSHIGDFVSLHYRTSNLDHNEYWKSFNKISIVDDSKATNDIFTKYSYRQMARSRNLPLTSTQTENSLYIPRIYGYADLIKKESPILD